MRRMQIDDAVDWIKIQFEDTINADRFFLQTMCIECWITLQRKVHKIKSDGIPHLDY